MMTTNFLTIKLVLLALICLARAQQNGQESPYRAGPNKIPVMKAKATSQRESVDASDGRYSASWDSLDTRPLPAWYDEAKFGIFIHWVYLLLMSWNANMMDYVRDDIPWILPRESTRCPASAANGSGSNGWVGPANSITNPYCSLFDLVVMKRGEKSSVRRVHGGQLSAQLFLPGIRAHVHGGILRSSTMGWHFSKFRGQVNQVL